MAHEVAASGSLMFLPHFDVFCDLIYLSIRLFALDFYCVIVDEGEARINYHAIEIESE